MIEVSLSPRQSNGRLPTSVLDFHAVLSNSKPYQASSIHSRQRLSATYMQPNSPELPPPPPPPPPPGSPQKQPSIFAGRSARERRLLSNLWLTSAATFRRMGKIEQAKAAIQEAEVADEGNEDVWVQVNPIVLPLTLSWLTACSRSSDCTLLLRIRLARRSSPSTKRSSSRLRTSPPLCTSPSNTSHLYQSHLVSPQPPLLLIPHRHEITLT